MTNESDKALSYIPQEVLCRCPLDVDLNTLPTIRPVVGGVVEILLGDFFKGLWFHGTLLPLGVLH